MKPRLRLVETVTPRVVPVPRIPPREDVIEYEGGHVWKRYPHEALVLKVISRRDYHG